MKQRSLLLRLHNLSSFDTNDEKERAASFDMIFREIGRTVSPVVSKAHPIEESSSIKDVIFPCTIEFENGESSELSDAIGDDWAMDDDNDDDILDDDGTSTNDFHPIETVTPLSANQTSHLYSFYFEENNMDVCDDDATSVTLHDVVTLDEDDYSLGSIQDNPEDFWSTPAIIAHERSSSIAQISLSSGIGGEW